MCDSTPLFITVHGYSKEHAIVAYSKTFFRRAAVIVHSPSENICYTDHRRLSSLLCAPTLRLEGARGTTSASSDWSCLHFLLQVPCLPFMSAFCCICLFVMSCPVKLKCTRKLAGVSVTTIRFETHRFSLRTKATAHHRCATQELLR